METRSDTHRTQPISDEEDRKITAAALSDPDNQPLTEEFFERAIPSNLRRHGYLLDPMDRLVVFTCSSEVLNSYFNTFEYILTPLIDAGHVVLGANMANNTISIRVVDHE